MKLGPLPEPTAPEGKAFDGWYTAKSGGDMVNADTAVTRSVTLYAQWKEITYTVTYSYKDGEETKTKDVTYGWNTTYDSKTDEMPAVTVPGGKKLIWSETEDGTEAFDMTQGVTANKTLYAVLVSETPEVTE